MEAVEILKLLSQGEDSRTQFKKNIHNPDSLAQELIAFSNTLGGRLLIGVDDDASIAGLSADDVCRINNLLSNVASQNVKPAINPLTEIVTIGEARILIIDVAKGINKPYLDKNGAIWVKSGADIRKATSREEMQRLFQSAGMLHADTTPSGLSMADLDMQYFEQFFEKRYGEKLADRPLSLEQTISNMNLGKDGELNLSGALLFSKNPSMRLPAFIVRAGAFPGKTISSDSYIDSRNIEGKIADIFQHAMSFLLANIKHVQGDQGVNSVGKPEVPRIVLEELLTNAIIHRDYFISAPIRIFVFIDRIEIISPGHLPNNLSVENIKSGNSNCRNPVLASFAYQLMPYRGFGSGILRALKNYPDIDFVDDREGNQFKCIIKRQTKN